MPAAGERHCSIPRTCDCRRRSKRKFYNINEGDTEQDIKGLDAETYLIVAETNLVDANLSVRATVPGERLIREEEGIEGVCNAYTTMIRQPRWPTTKCNGAMEV